MTGGIYCEVPLGTIYEVKTLGSIHKRMRELLGTSEGVPTEKPLNQQIIDHWYEDIRDRMSKILSTWKVPGNRGYYNRTVDLTRSICLGVYHNGKLRKMYRFTGGHSEKTAFNASDQGTGSSVSSTIRTSYLGINRHPDPEARAKAFLNEYDLVYKSGFTFVIAATMPYAVRLESGAGGIGQMSTGYGLPVLSQVINRMLYAVYQFKKGSGGVLYGYIFESTGGYQS